MMRQFPCIGAPCAGRWHEIPKGGELAKMCQPYLDTRKSNDGGGKFEKYA